MARLHDIVVDCSHPASLARFWAEVLDGYAVAPYDDAELTRLRAQGIETPEDDPTVLVEPAGHGPRLWFQRVPEPKQTKNRVHLDLSCDGLDEELARLADLGAHAVQRELRDTGDWALVLDPEGNELCLWTFGSSGS